MIAFLFSQNLYARRGRISLYYDYKIVADLPNSAQYLIDSGDKSNSPQYLDLAIETKEYALNKTIPMWVNGKPNLVGYNQVLGKKVSLDEDAINQIIKDNHLNKEELLKLNIYRKYGGYIVLVCLIITGYCGYLPLKRSHKKVDRTNV